MDIVDSLNWKIAQLEKDLKKAIEEHPVYYNETDGPIFIVVKYRPDPSGCPGIIDHSYYIGPGQGIEFESIGFGRRKKDGKIICAQDIGK